MLTRCSLLRRMAAIFYDVLLLFSIFFFSTFIMLPFTDGQAISDDNIPYITYLLTLSYLYFIWQWIHSGQTLGMRTWHVRVMQVDVTQVTLQRATLRFLLSILSWLMLGFGFLWALFDKQGLTFHDRYSGTFLEVNQS